MTDSFYQDLLVELECPICTAYMTPPIRQCATGHSICETCRNNLPKCGLCQEKFTESRNISLEGLAVKMRYPCINKPFGCDSPLAYNEREVHELQCKYKGYQCAMEKCTWVGSLEELITHWVSKKTTSKSYHGSNLCHTKMKTESYYVNLVQAYNKVFWFKCKLYNKKLYWAVQYIGSPSEAENYFYEIEVFKPGRTKQKILISDYCQSINLENINLLKEGACVCMYIELIEHYLNEEQVLMYYMRVHQVGSKGMPSKKEESNVDKFTNRQRDRSKGPPNLNRFKEYKKKSPSKKEKQTNDGFVVV